MKTIKKIKAELDDLQLIVMDGEEALVVDELEEQDALELLQCSAKLMDTLQLLIGDIKALLGHDLKDIWERLDGLEEK